ncbi:MAG: ABC transporter ATP-binding protein [Alkaliphilus sp.]
MTKILEIKNLNVDIEGKRIIKDLNITILEGEVHVLFGLNGSGKTSLLMTIMGYPEYEIVGGQILFRGVDLAESDITKRARLGLGILQQRPPTIKGVTLQQIIDYVINKKIISQKVVEEYLLKYRVKQFLNRDINDGFSGGEIKRSEIFQLLITSPSFFMLDEPDSGIDLDNIKVIAQMVDELVSERDADDSKRTGLVISHTGEIMKYIKPDLAHVMLDGRIECKGDPIEILKHIEEHGYEECIKCFG